MQLNDPQQQNYHNIDTNNNPNFQMQNMQAQGAPYEGQRQYSREDYVDSENSDEEQQEEPQNYIQEQDEESDTEEPQNLAAMQSKFAGVKVESAQMFDEESLHNNQPQMEPIQETYSSDDSY